MFRLAIVLFEESGSDPGGRLRLSVVPAPGLGRQLRSIGGVPDLTRTVWAFPGDRLEPLLSLLDRRGYRWGLGAPSDLPRTWAERMFAEVPAPSHVRALDACRWAFAGDPEHLALLEYAYRQAQERGPRSEPVVGGYRYHADSA